MKKTVQQQLQEAYLQMHSGATTKALSEDEQIVEDLLALDEISKKTLGSYIKKAARDMGTNKFQHGYGVGKTMSKDDPDYGDKVKHKAAKRLNGIIKATSRLTKEQKETIEDILEDLDAEFALEEALALYELSKKTLGSYIKKASGDAADKASRMHNSFTTSDDRVGSFKKALKRLKGVNKATDKLTKEQQEFIGSILESIEEESED